MASLELIVDLLILLTLVPRTVLAMGSVMCLVMPLLAIACLPSGLVRHVTLSSHFAHLSLTTVLVMVSVVPPTLWWMLAPGPVHVNPASLVIAATRSVGCAPTIAWVMVSVLVTSVFVTLALVVMIVVMWWLLPAVPTIALVMVDARRCPVFMPVFARRATLVAHVCWRSASVCVPVTVQPGVSVLPQDCVPVTLVTEVPPARLPLPCVFPIALPTENVLMECARVSLGSAVTTVVKLATLVEAKLDAMLTRITECVSMESAFVGTASGRVWAVRFPLTTRHLVPLFQPTTLLVSSC